MLWTRQTVGRGCFGGAPFDIYKTSPGRMCAGTVQRHVRKYLSAAWVNSTDPGHGLGRASVRSH